MDELTAQDWAELDALAAGISDEEWQRLAALAAEDGDPAVVEAFGAGGSQKGLLAWFKKHALGTAHPHTTCVNYWKGKVANADAMCAKLKDLATGTTKWRGAESVLAEKEFSAERRRELAKSGAAMADGSFPIESRQDVMNAVHAIGRASNPAAAKAHIKKRARALGCMDLLPDDWKDSDMSESHARGRLTETVTAEIVGITEGTNGSEFDVLIIQPGGSLNGNQYSRRVLEAAAPKYQASWCYLDHSPSSQRSVRDKIGRFKTAVYETRTVGGVPREGVYGRLRVIDPAWRDRLREAVEAGEADGFGFSHSVSADWTWEGTGAARTRQVRAITKVHSVDLVDQPAAGGRLVAGMGEDEDIDMDSEELRTTIAESVAAAMREANVSLAAAIREAFAPPAQGTGTSGTAIAGNTEATPGTSGTNAEHSGVLSDALAEAQKAAAATLRAATQERQRGELRRKLDATKVSEVGKTLAIRHFEEALARREMTDADIDATVKEAVEYEGLFTQENAAPQGLSAIRFQVGNAGREKFMKDLAATYAGPQEKLEEGVTPFRSLKHAYFAFTGNYDADIYQLLEDWTPRGGYISSRDHNRITESITTASWAEINADVMYQRLVAAYRSAPWYDQWRLLCSDIESVEDFRTRHWMAFGGYGDLPAVAEGATYTSTTSPTDQEVTYAVSKRGYLDDITMEAVTNDQVGVVRRIPTEMGRAAARTLYKFVMAMVTTDNANMDYDSAALYVAGHSNTGTTALSISGLDTTEQAMMAQTGYGQTSEILGPRNRIKYIIVPAELTARAERIINPSDAYLYAWAAPADTETVMDPQRFKGSGIQVLTYHELTDATDWWAVADPNEVPTVVMGFLAGRQEPELIIQDQPQNGSVFTADKTSWKCRHIYGGDVIDHRSFYRQVVAG